MSNENDDQYEGQHDEDEVDEQEEQPPSKRPRARQPPPQVIVVPQAPRQKAPRNLNAAPRNRFIKNSDMVRISKRIAGGKRSHIGDYTSEDIGPGISLQQFIKEYIDEENREPGRTVYEVVPLNGNGDEIGRPQQYIIENQSFAETNPNDPVGQARSVLDLFADLKEQENEKQSQNSEMLKEAQKKAIAGGDMQGLFMFMMMNQMMDRPRGGIDEAAIIAKVLDRLGPQQQPMMMPPPLPPVQMVPPAPAPLAGAMEQLVQASIASMLKPDAPPPSPIQQLKDMMELQTLMQKMSGSGTDMATVVKLLLEKQTPVKPPEVAGVDNMMLTFEKLTTMVKALAPQINQGGWAGPIQGIFSQPEVQKAIANILGGVTGQPGAVAPQLPPGAPGAQTVNGQAANANGQVQPQPQQPQPQPTPQMRDAANAFRIAQTKEVRVERLMQLIQVMYLAGYQPVIEPVLTAARDGNIVPAQRFLATLIADIDPSKVTVDLINAVLRVSAGLAGEEGKKMMAALDASEKGETLKVEEKKPGTVETPNAQVVPIAAAPAHANHAAYMAQVAELERQKEGKKDGGMATQPSVPPAANPHAPEVEVKEKKVVEAKVEVATEAQTPKVEAQTPSQTPPAEVINFNEKPEKPAEQTAR
ncbi:MAG: hypothetical protein EPN91_08465 [Salinibacterium sp.]|nr:MAG: hypothetical protein EPN91_08465 [Salinibacterium sp.]